MERLTSFLAGTVILAALILLLASAQPAALEATGLDIWNLPKLYQDIEDNLKIREEYDERFRQVLARLRAKEWIAAEVVAGRMALLEAAARFRILNETTQDTVHALTRSYPGDSVEEQNCHQVIHYIRLELRDLSPELEEAVVVALLRELAEHKAAHGRVALRRVDLDEALALEPQQRDAAPLRASK